jgi:predicted secreted protein
MESEAKELRMGTSLPIILPGLGTAGFQWFYKADNTNSIEIHPYDYTVDAIFRSAGTSNDDVFIVTGKAPGRTNIIFEQRRSWEKDGAVINTRNFEITVV